MATLSLGAPPAGPEEVKRRRRTYLVVGVAATVLAVAGFAAARQPESTVSATPGYRDVDRPIDTSPFELARATERGTNTTIAGLDGFADGVATTQPTLPPPPTTLPPTTTTLPLPQPPDDPACIAYFSWITLIRDSRSATVDPRTFANQAVITMVFMSQTLSSSGEPLFAPAAAMYAAAAARLEGATTSQRVNEVVVPIVTEADPDIIAALTPLKARVEQRCADLRAAALD